MSKLVLSPPRREKNQQKEHAQIDPAIDLSNNLLRLPSDAYMNPPNTRIIKVQAKLATAAMPKSWV